ncbi:uncharacterized protein LOC135217393 [Macrobrachium nipponense]|uniref:uncharacterized protein LOC135217393 n=1 Tax=Macrobrachium nipponense TaxID=159736 RepID=UPI0030C830BB
MTTSFVLNDVSQQLRQIWNCEDDSERHKIHEQYMKVFSDVWKESVLLFDKVENGLNTKETQQENETQEVKNETEESIEDLEIRHEATLIVVTKKRKEYPSRIANYLGKKRRLQKNAVQIMKVELPLRTPLEVEEPNYTVADLSFKNSQSVLSESLQHLQPCIQRLNNLADAVSTLQMIHDDPAEKICSAKSL